jgi:alpha,alpha-trehalase
MNSKEKTCERVVRMADGSFMNRYWDSFDSPRPESYKEDIETASESDRPINFVYRDIRAGAESGWDFSSRWFKDKPLLSSIHTTDIIPVDLNALLYHLEMTLSEAQQVAGNKKTADIYLQKALARKRSLIQFCWNEQKGIFMDYDFKTRCQTNVPSLATVYPLYFNMADSEHAEKIAQVIEKDFLQIGGVVTTLVRSGEQWDAPNGWAPLQWMTIKGLRNYHHNKLANTIKERWVNLNVNVYKKTGKMVEKYNVMDIELKATDGEYPLQDGFGWTNGVLLKLLLE